MNDLNDMSTPTNSAAMRLLKMAPTSLTGLIVFVMLCISIHAGVQEVYDYVEDKCVAGVCVDRVPNGP